MQLVEVVFEDTAALRPQRGAQYPLGDERVAITIAADPAADAQKGREAIRARDARARELLFEIGVKPR